MVKTRYIFSQLAILLLIIPNLTAQTQRRQRLDALQDPSGYMLRVLSTNVCLSYLQDTIGKSNVVFKSVSEIKYYSKDSLITDKKLKSKKTYYFNRRGQITSFITSDTIGKVTDSAVAFYDEKFHPLSLKEYAFEESQGKLVQQGELTNVFDDNGNCIRMKNWSYRPNPYKEYLGKSDKDENDTTVEMSFSTFNDKGKLIKSVSTDNKHDTTTLYYNYNSDNQLASLKGVISSAKEGESNMLALKFRMRAGSYNSNSYFMKFDNNGNIIQTVEMDNKDTLKNEVSTFDDMSRMTSKTVYEKGKLKEKQTSVFGADKEHTDITDEYGSSGSDELDISDDEGAPTACVIDTRTVEVYNNFGDLDSSKVTITGSGKPSIKTTANKYVYNYFGKALSDSETVVEQSEYHASGTLTVYDYKYDNWGNMLEKVGKGGEGTSSDIRTTYSYNKQNYLLTEEDYGSCLDTPYATYKIMYYPDGITEKELETSRGKNHYIYRFGEDTRKLENIFTTSYGVEQTVYEYQNW